MTRLLLRVRSAKEAATATQAGVDVVAFAPSRADAGDRATAVAIRSAFPGPLRILVEGAADPAQAATLAAEAGAEELAIPADVLLAGPFEETGIPVVATVPGRATSRDLIARLRGRAQAATIVFDRGSSPFAQTDIATLDGLATACHASGLGFGIAGDIEEPDVVRLLLLSPDHLGFDATVRLDGLVSSPVDISALEAIRTLIPSPGTERIRRSASGSTDRIFVRDFVVEMSIGAYRSERAACQRVRFDVEVEVEREPKPPRDMRDVFSYDIVIETIRVLAQRTHVAFVETLAEEVAAKVLAHAAVRSTTVRVSKLDVIAGAVGIEIHRERRP